MNSPTTCYMQIVGVGFALFNGYPVFKRTELASTLQFIIGFTMAMVGYILWAVSRIQLGSSFSILPAVNDKLVSSGLYAYFSNPLYLFSTISIAGYALLLNRSELLFILLLLVVPVQIYRARKEARILQERFGEEYFILSKKVFL
jgi:protein-S-isoprenylcysteine O-methyltransferase Ste14